MTEFPVDRSNNTDEIHVIAEVAEHQEQPRKTIILMQEAHEGLKRKMFASNKADSSTDNSILIQAVSLVTELKRRSLVSKAAGSSTSNGSLIQAISLVTELPHVNIDCDAVASTPVCWQIGKHKKCTSVWPDVLIQPDSDVPMFLEGRPQAEGLGHAFKSFLVWAVIAAKNRLTLRAHLTTGGHGDADSVIKERIFGDYFFSPMPDTCTQT